MASQVPSHRGVHYGTVVTVFVAGVLMGLLANEWLSPANAQIPDAGSQRNELRQEVQRTNTLLAEMLDTLRRETLKVEVVEADNKGDGRARDRQRRSQPARSERPAAPGDQGNE